MQAAIPTESLYEYTLRITQVVDYGAPAQGILSGEVPPPPEGARIDIHFEGSVTGRLSGTVRGVDYLHVRADGRAQLDIHAEITTSDGKKVALHADGVAIPVKGTPVFDLRENVTLTTSHPEYAWVNTLQIWAPGTADLSTGEVRVKGLLAQREMVGA
jgi:hypothetical protein